MPSEWLPIESARRDGKAILLYIRWAGKRHRVVSRWSDYDGAWIAELTNYPVRATHWQPLPAPPEAT